MNVDPKMLDAKALSGFSRKRQRPSVLPVGLSGALGRLKGLPESRPLVGFFHNN
jgi:hypothetical protein